MARRRASHRPTCRSGSGPGAWQKSGSGLTQASLVACPSGPATVACALARTGGQVAIVEHPFPAGSLVPPHVHTREDESPIVIAGAIGFRSGSDEVVLEAGGYISKPRGEGPRRYRLPPVRG